MNEQKNCGRLVIAGTASGVGKTSLTLGIIRSLARNGLRVQPFKAGPDFLDPTYLSLASLGRTSYNLDGWMMGRQYIGELFDRACGVADIALVEGVMGLFDGADSTTLNGSTAELAMWLVSPVLLVADAHGSARSFAAVIKGFSQFEREIHIAGVIANRCGSARHKAWLAESLAAANLPGLVGAMPLGALPELESRHLGLLTADPHTIRPELIDRLADACEQHLDIPAIMRIADCGLRPAFAEASAGKIADCGIPHHGDTESTEKRNVVPLRVLRVSVVNLQSAIKVRVGIARDQAFHFYYQDNLDALEEHGAELVPFSPIADSALPADLGGLYIGGGYPEEHAESLAANRSMLESVRAFADAGRPIYAECGGLMYLAEELTAKDGRHHPMAGVLPVSTRMLPKLKSLGYVEIALTEDSLWGERGAAFRGHEFHYSELDRAPSPGSGWQTVYAAHHSSGSHAVDGFQKGNVLASYAHLHFASRRGAAEHFLERCTK